MSSRQIKISIVTVCLNAEPNIVRTIESVLNQEYGNLEYLVIDGASTDGTLSLIGRYGGRISKIVSERDKGISDAMNKGICASSGEVVGLLHAGDMYESDTLSLVADFFAQNPGIDVVHGNVSYADVNGNFLYEQRPDFREGIIWKKMPFHHPTCFVRRRSYEKFGFFDISYRVAMDYELMLRFHCRGAKFDHIDRKLAVMCLKGLSDRNWRQSISESRKAAISLGRNKALAHATEIGRILRTSATVAYSRITGRTLRESFPHFRNQTSPVRVIVDGFRFRHQ